MLVVFTLLAVIQLVLGIAFVVLSGKVNGGTRTVCGGALFLRTDLSSP